MEKLLEMARTRATAAETFSFEREGESLSLEGGVLESADSCQRSGKVLRILQGTTLGTAHTVNVTDPEVLLEEAVRSLRAGTEGPAAFGTQAQTPLDYGERLSRAQSFMELSKESLADELLRIVEFCGSRCDATLNAHAEWTLTKTRLANTHGTDASDLVQNALLKATLLFPGGAEMPFAARSCEGMPHMPDDNLAWACALFKAGERVVRTTSGRKKVIFAPAALDSVLMRRLREGTCARRAFERVSPLASRQGERVLSPVFTLHDDPTQSSYRAALAMDGEGLATRRTPVFEKGVFRNFATNLTYARKLGLAANGIGFRTEFSAPLGIFSHPVLEGTHTLADMLALMQEGILLMVAMGGHSGNVINGDYSVGLNPAFLVDKGEIVGLLPDAMLAGNAYDTLSRTVAISHETCAHTGLPYVMCEGVDFAQKA